MHDDLKPTNYDTHCDGKIVNEIFSTKNKFNTVNRELFTSARTRSNPYELLKSHFFMNRAALKMAEIDHMMGLFKSLCKGWGSKQPGGSKSLLTDMGELRSTSFNHALSSLCYGP